MAEILLLEDLPLIVTVHGEWLHGSRSLHPRVADLFARHIVPLQSGSYQIELGQQRHPVEVRDTAFFVRSIVIFTQNELVTHADLLLSDGRREALDFATLMQSSENVLYCRIVRAGLVVPCRFLPAPYHSLALHMDIDVGTEMGMIETAQGKYSVGDYVSEVFPLT